MHFACTDDIPIFVSTSIQNYPAFETALEASHDNNPLSRRDQGKHSKKKPICNELASRDSKMVVDRSCWQEGLEFDVKEKSLGILSSNYSSRIRENNLPYFLPNQAGV